jgi:hypothetical protein
MNKGDFNQLSGNLRALEEMVLCLARRLEIERSIDGPKFTDAVKNWAGKFRPADPENSDQLAQLQAFHGAIERMTLCLESARPDVDPDESNCLTDIDRQ